MHFFFHPMSKRGSDEHRLNAFHDNAIDDSSNPNIGSKIFRQLEVISSQRISNIDYEEQIDRWNRYQELLDKIDKKCGREAGVRLARNAKHNVKIFTDTTTAALCIIALTALMSMWESYTTNSLIGTIVSTIAIGFVGWQSFIRFHHPSLINFRCSPVLHIDEFAYMSQTIKGIPAVEHDPKVRLPVLEMRIPRAWLGQRGMIKFMESLSDIKLDDVDVGDRNGIS